MTDSEQSPISVSGPQDVGVVTADEPSVDVAGVVSEPVVAEQIVDEPVVDEPDSPLFIVVYVASVLFELPATHPILTMREEQWPYRTLSFPIGLPEAQSVALALEETRAARPSTHEMFSDALAATQNDIIAARIVSEQRGVYYAELDLMNPRGRTVLDCRPTDAIILALRQKVPAPILIDATLMHD